MTGRADPGPLVAVLAAGLARRFGGGKLDAPLLGRPLGAWALDAVAQAGLNPGVIVVGPDSPQFARQAAGWGLVINPEPEKGMGRSVALAVEQAMEQGRDCLILLADMPLVAPSHLQQLMRTPSSSATRWPDARLGVPALIRRRDLARFRMLEGDRGAAPLLAGMERLVPVSAPSAMLLDVDRTEDLDEVRRLLEARERD